MATVKIKTEKPTIIDVDVETFEGQMLVVALGLVGVYRNNAELPSVFDFVFDLHQKALADKSSGMEALFNELHEARVEAGK